MLFSDIQDYFQTVIFEDESSLPGLKPHKVFLMPSKIRDELFHRCFSSN